MKTAWWIIVAAVLVSSDISAAETANLKMRFVYDADPPTVKPIDDAARFATDHGVIIDEGLLVHPGSNGIQNVVVQLYTGRGGSEIELPPYQGTLRRLTMESTRFEPHIVLARAGDTLQIIEHGPELHNPNFAFFNNPVRGIMVPPGKTQSILLAFSEPAPIPIACNIHHWMEAYLVVLDHPFVAVSDPQGDLTITGLPTNKPLVFRVFHESGRFNNVRINGVLKSWDRGRFEMELKPGFNDLGDILISAETFR